jgi:5-(carboxyamino)imidazole ribonucleotide synthase
VPPAAIFGPMGQRVIALLGGGQLGRMFIENALRYDVRVEVMDPDASAPCSRIAHRFVQGDIQDAQQVIDFARDADVVGLEIEHVSVEGLEQLKAMGKLVIPDPEVLRVIQDKGLQKEFYRTHDIPSSPYALVGSIEELQGHDALFPAFLKSRRGGYDGRGVMPLEVPGIPSEGWPWPSVLEKQVDIALELAVLVARNEIGTQITYDPVEMVFDPRYNLVDHLRAPARIGSKIGEEARRLASRVASAFAAPGIYAVELFLTKSGDLLVNETAPRAHNSGHHTIEACASSQFDQLLRLYMGWPLGDATLRTPAAMINLVGEGGSGMAEMQGMSDILHVPGTFVHLYGKRETRTGRKMGHITVTADDEAMLDQAIAVTRVHCRVVPSASTSVA